MTIVNQQSLAKKIKSLASRVNAEYGLGLTINEEYQLEAYRMLLRYLASERPTGSGDKK